MIFKKIRQKIKKILSSLLTTPSQGAKIVYEDDNYKKLFSKLSFFY